MAEGGKGQEEQAGQEFFHLGSRYPGDVAAVLWFCLAFVRWTAIVSKADNWR